MTTSFSTSRNIWQLHLLVLVPSGKLIKSTDRHTYLNSLPTCQSGSKEMVIDYFHLLGNT